MGIRSTDGVVGLRQLTPLRFYGFTSFNGTVSPFFFQNCIACPHGRAIFGLADPIGPSDQVVVNPALDRDSAMLDATGRKLLKLLQPGHSAEMRAAAARAIGEIRLRDKETARLLIALLDDPDADPRRQAITALGKLRIEQALKRLLDRVGHGGPDSDLAAQAVAQLGAKGVNGLRSLMGQVAPGLRRRIAAALTASGALTDSPTAVVSLLDGDPGVVDAAARTLSAEIPTLSVGHRQALADHLLDLLKSKRKSPALSIVTQAAVVRLLGALQDPRAVAIFWEHLRAPYPPELRAAALQALGAKVDASKKAHLQSLFDCAADPDFRVAAPAMLILRTLPVTAASLPAWLMLLDAPDVGVRRLGMEKVGDHDRPEIAAALLQQLTHRDRGVRDEALARLGRLDHGRRALANALLEAENPDHAWLLARAQEPFVRDYEPALRKRLLDRACAYLEEGDRRSDALLFVLRAADATGLRDALEERALALRRKKKYEAAMLFLRLLARDPGCGAPIRMELAACGLKTSAHDLNAEARAADPCLQSFANLVHSFPDELVSFLRKSKWLEPKDLFYLGFHFAEKEKQEKQFGGQVLKLVIDRAKAAKVGRDARSKLRNEGLD
jgi:HEAT repeat protein